MKRISYYVLAIHCFFVLWSALWMPNKKVDKKPLQVRMVVQAPPKVAVALPPPAAVVKAVVQKTAPVKPTPIAKAAPVRPVAKKTAPAPVKSAPAVPANLVQQLQESIAKIDQKSHKDSPKEVMPAPKWVPELRIDEESTGEENLFVATLVQCLQETLDLPEFGSVKVELVLRRDGSFVKMKVLHSESEKNKKFLEQELKTVSFPPFNGNLKNEKEHLFVITFCNS